ncbi:MAG TPA: Ig-like domain-containing protein [Candidatus Peribacterales bacterium]|nr:Ig-like domain-containing protein [Candidatus Peribacterales bacterium]
MAKLPTLPPKFHQFFKRWWKAEQIKEAVVVMVITLLVTIPVWYRQEHRVLQGSAAAISTGTRYVKVATDSILRFDFPEAIEKASAMENLVVPEGVTGTITWEGNVMLFTPSAPLTMEETYSFVMKEGAMLEDGRPLQKELTFVFSVEGPPKIVSRIPAPDSVDIPRDAVITMIFDRPMVPLVHVYGKEELQLKDWKVKLNPEVAGKWRWLGTSTVEFRPSEALQLATKYTMDVPPGIKSIAGDEIAENYSWGFETLRPKVMNTDPYEGSVGIGPDAKIRISWNQEMNVEALRSFVSLQQNLGDAPTTIGVKISYGTKKEGKNEKEVTDPMTIIVTPEKPLPLDSVFTLHIGKDAPGRQGNLGMQEDFSLTFRTAAPFKIERTETNEYGVRLYFNNPYESEKLKDFIAIDPKPVNWDEFDLTRDEWEGSATLSLFPELRPSTEYTFTVKKGLRDVFQQTLKEDYVIKMSTPPLPPRVFIHSEGEFGIFEKEKPPIFYLNALNVSRMDVDFSPLALRDFLSIQRSKKQNYEYAPALTQFAGYEHWSIDKPIESRDSWNSLAFDLEEKLGKKLSPGIYALTLQAPEYIDYRGVKIVEQQYFALTNMAITLKYTGKHALVWVIDVGDGTPVENAAITFHSLSGESKMKGVTDANGFFEVDLPLKEFYRANEWEDPEFWVTAEKEGDFAFVGNYWNMGVNSYDFGYEEDFLSIDEPEYKAETYLYTERPLYRAGQTVHFKGIARLRDSNGMLHPPIEGKRSAKIVVKDSQDKEIFSQTLPINTYGSFNGDIAIAEDAALGTYSLQATVIPDSDIAPQYQWMYFEVLAYRKPEYRASITFPKEDYFDRETLNAEIEGAYYFGAPMDGATVHWGAFSTDYFFNRYTDGWYSFSNSDTWCFWDCERGSNFLAEGEGKLDAKGKYQISLPLSLEGKNLSQVVSIEATILDRNNQSVSAWESVPVHLSSVYVGIRPENYGVEPGEEVEVALVTVNPDGSPAPRREVELSLFSREWNTIQKKGVDGSYYYENEVKDTFVSKKSVRTDSDGKVIGSIMIEKGGSYRIVATVLDDKGRRSEAGTDIYSYSNTYFNWPRSNSDRMEVVADKPEYKVGDTAKLIVKSPYQGKGVKALITVERENIIEKRLLDVESNALPIEIPITEDLIPNAYVSIVILKARQGETFDESGLDTGLPAFAMGLERLKVETARKVMSVEITTNEKKYLPRATVNVTLRTRDALGKPIPAEVSLSAVDMSVLALTGFQKPDLVQFFYTLRPLGVRTAHMLLYMLERFKPGSKGGGGGFGDEQGKRDTFKDTAYWNPTIMTNEQGEASVSFVLPDNLTTWKLLAVAHNKESLFGAEDEEIIETKRVIVRPVRPRFAVHRDQIGLGAIVHNFTEEPQTFTVTLKGEGFRHKGDDSHRVRVEPGEQTKVEFPVEITAMDKVKLNFTAEGEELRDEIEETIPVYLFSVPQAVATSGITTEKIEESVYAPDKDRALDLKLTATLSPSLATYLPEGLEYVSEFPYGCSEQILSSLLPNIALKSLQGFEAFKIVPDEELNQKVTKGIASLYQNQRGDGGFGYWPESYESSPSLTAYIAFGLEHAKREGFTVDQNVLDRAYQYLLDVLRKPPDPTKPWFMSDTIRAQILFTLGEGGRTDVALLNNLYEKRKELPLFAQAFYVMALQKGGSSVASKAKQLRTEIQNNARVSPRGVHFEENDVRDYRWSMNTNARTTALVLMALLRGDSTDALIPRTIRYLLSIREDGHWDTTQSTTFTLLAFTEYLEKTKELDAEMTASLSLNGKVEKSAPFNKENILSREEIILTQEKLKEAAFNTVTIGKEGTGQLYYDLLMSYVWLADELPPVEEGMSIMRNLEPVEKDDPGLRAGTNHRVTLTITVPEDRHFVAVESPLPAGMEAIDLHLATNQQSLGEEVNQKTYESWEDWWMSRNWYFTHTEYRDDRVFLFADMLPAGVYTYEYLVRATTPGTFYERPARVYEMYFPENFGQTAGGTVTIDAARE